MNTQRNFCLIAFLLISLFNAHAQFDTSRRILEAPQEIRNGQLYSNFVKVKLRNSNVIPSTGYSQRFTGTSCISATAASLKVIFDSHVLAASGNPATVLFQRENLDEYISGSIAKEIFDVHLGVTLNLDDLMKELRADPNVEFVNPPYCIYTTGVPNNNQGLVGNPFANWHINKIQASEAWVFLQPYATTPGTVAVVDGDAVGAQVYEPHTFLSGKVTNEPPVNSNCPTYGNHPTMVASCVTAKDCSVSCSQPVGAGRNFIKVSSHGYSCGINNAFLEIWNMPIATRPKVINCSWVFLYYTSSPPFPPIGWAGVYQSYSNINLNTIVLEQLIAAGTTVVASSGNFMSAANSCATSQYCFSLRGVGYPFGLPGVIGVGGTSPTYINHPGYEFGMGSGNNPTFYNLGTSSGGNWNYNYNNPALTNPIDIANQNTGYLDIVAPGDEIDVASYPGTPSSLTGAGTSFASPIVAAAAASMLLVNPNLTQADVTRILTETADKVGYNPNGMTLADLNSSVSFTKGYTYSNTGNVSNGGFYNNNLDYVMGNGRLNMLSAVMNAAGLSTGGFTITNSASFPVTSVTVNDVNDHSYLTGTAYNKNYEYDAILNQNGANVYFNSGAAKLVLATNSTFRIMNGAKMNFTTGASLLMSAGTVGKGTKCVVGSNGTLALKDNTFNITANSYLEADATGSLTVNNATIVVQSGGSLHIKSNAFLSLTSTGKIIVNSGGFICVEPGAIISNNGVINLTANVNIGVSPSVNTPPGTGCLAPCIIIPNISYSGSGSVTYTTCLAFTTNNITSVSCLTPNSGSITVNVTGGTGPYTYSWSNTQTTQTATGLAAGNYTVTVTDAASNTLTGIFTVNGPATVAANVSSTNVFCSGGLNSGTASANPSGGSSPYTYLWSNSQTAQTATGLAVGVYTVTVTDLVGCAVTSTVAVINDPVNSPMLISTTASSVSCPGGSNGTATVTVVGGNQTPTYSAAWSNSTGVVNYNHIATGLTGGTYTVSITDASNCSQTATLTIAQPPAFVSTFSLTPVTTCTASNGSATVNVSGGTPAYTYSWSTSPVQTTQTATGLSLGVYSVTITDANSCVKTSTILVNNSTLTAGIVASNVSCYGLTNGSATATVTSGGTAPYTYQWGASAGYQTTQAISNLNAGNYYVVITDALGNCGNAIASVTTPSAPIYITFITSYYCSGATIMANPTGGTPPYTYTWSPGGQNTQIKTGAPAGFNSVNVTDAMGCTNYYYFAVGIPPLPSLIVVATYTPATGACTSSNGSASVSSIVNGNAPYTYLWSNSQTTQTATGLVAGTYSVTVTDANGCSASTTVNVTNSSGPSLSVTHTNATCTTSTGSATVTASGGTLPYTYLWSTSQTTQSVTGLAAGTYTVKVTDASGACNVISVTINPPPVMALSLLKTTVSCSPGNDGTATVGSVFGATAPYTYLWSNSQTTQTATGLAAGNYSVQVTDAAGCVGTGTISLPVPGISIYLGRTNVSCYGGNDGSAYFAGFYASPGTPPYTYLWAPGSQTTSVISGLAAGNYTLTVTDAGGCTSTVAVPVSQPNQIILSATSSAATGSCTSPNGTASVGIVSGGTAPFSYLWSTIPAQTTAVATGLLAGAYTATVTDANSCTALATVTLTGVSGPTITATASPTAICAGSSCTLTAAGGTTYTWQPGALTTASIAVSPSSTMVYTLTGSNGICSSSIAKTIIVNAVPVLAISPSTASVCAGSPVTLTVGGASTYSWSPASGLNTTTGATVIASPSVTTSYTITGTNASGCTAQAVYVVSVTALPVVGIAPATATICSGSSLTLTASGAATYSWSPPSGLSSTTGYTASASPGSTTNYTVTGTNAGGCSAQAVSMITVKPTPTVTASPSSTTSCISTPVALTAGGASTYSWTPATALSASTGSMVTASPTTSITYTITGTTSGCSNTATVQVTLAANNCTAAAGLITGSSSYGASTNMGLGSPASIGIMANITFTAGTSSITCNDVRIAPNVQITVKNGATLNITTSWLHSCATCGGGMWAGIYVENGGKLTISAYTMIEDASSAISTQFYSSGTLVPDIEVTTTIFNKNTTALKLDLNNPNNVLPAGALNIIDNSVLTCRDFSSLSAPIPSSANFAAIKSALYTNSGAYATTVTKAGARSAYGFALTGAGTATYPYKIGEAATTTTAGVGAINIFDYMDYGVFAQSSVFEVKNNLFQNLKGNNVSTAFGTGIYQGVTTSTYPVSIGSSLTSAGANDGNYFKTCLRAIDLTGSDKVYIYNNTINNAATDTYTNFTTTGNWSGQYGVFIKPTGSAASVINCVGNNISNCALGIHINRSTNYNGTGISITNNTITAAGTPTLYCNKGVFLEDVTGCSSCMSVKTIALTGNTITYVEDKGIHCSNIQSGLSITCNNELSVRYKNVTNNTISGTTSDVIRLDNCKNSYTEYNANIKTSGGNTAVNNSNLTGIYINNSGAAGNNNAVDNNALNYLGACVVWEGDNSTAATFSYNQLLSGRHGLYMNTNAKISTQGSAPSGNRWGNTTLVYHTYVNNGGYDYNLSTSNSKLYVLNVGVSGGIAAVPTSNGGTPSYSVGTTSSFGIVKTSSSEIACPSCGCGGNPSGRMAGTQGAGEAEGSLTYGAVTPLAIKEAISNAGDHEQGWAAKKWAYEMLYNDPGLYMDNRDLDGFYKQMQHSNIAKLTEAEFNINNRRYSAADMQLQSIQPGNVPEQNLQRVYSILLQMLQHADAITADDKATLWSIASQCEHTGGEAVAKARALYNRLSNQAMLYAGNCDASDAPSRQETTSTEAGILFNLYPNPGNGEVTVDYDGLKGQDAMLTIYDVNGNAVHTGTLQGHAKRALIHAGDLADGVYMYKITVNGSIVKAGKIIILK